MNPALKGFALRLLLRLTAGVLVAVTAIRLSGRRVTWLSAPVSAFTLYLVPKALVLAAVAALR